MLLYQEELDSEIAVLMFVAWWFGRTKGAMNASTPDDDDVTANVNNTKVVAMFYRRNVAVSVGVKKLMGGNILFLVCRRRVCLLL